MSARGSHLSAWLIGDDSLLVECGETLLRAGHEIHGVVTSTARLGAWAREQGLRHEPASGDYASAMAERPFDFLFSITHLSIIPDAALALPRRFAVNFHDGPLPKYAGLNTPAWGLLQAEPTWAITWHVITKELDRGEILAQRVFDVSPRETSLTLNTRCFEAAIETFGALIDDLAAGRERRTAQQGAFTYYPRAQRPPAACVLDWSRPAPELDALVRALDFGRYTNPLGAPKIFKGSTALIVTRAEGRPRSAPAPAGQVLSASEAEFVVGAGEGSLAVQECSTLCGTALAPSAALERLGLRAGDSLDALTPDRAARLTALAATLAKTEARRARALASLEAPEVALGAPAPGASGRGAAALVVLARFRERFATGTGDALAAAFGAFLWRMGDKAGIDLAVGGGAFDRMNEGFEAFVSPRAALRFEIDATESGERAIARMTSALDALRAKGTCLRDLIARTVEVHHRGDLLDLHGLPVGIDLRDGPPGSAPAGSPAGAPAVVFVIGGSEGSSCTIEFDRARAAPEAAEALRDRFGLFLERLAAHPEAPLAEIDTLTEEERRRVLVEWNATEGEFPRSATIHSLFEAQAERTPDVAALAYGAEALTYREVNERANRLAHHLRSMGVARETLVGLYLDRSIDLVVAVLATQKAGGAYVPLDPDYPADRIAHMIEDSGAPVIVTTSDLAPSLPKGRARTVSLDAERETIAQRSAANLEAIASPESLAYVIYTSGSTGKPKGVMIEHRHAVNFFAGMDARIPRRTDGGQDVWLAVTSLSFDISVLELLWTLTRGFKVVVYSEAARRGRGARGRAPGRAVRTPGSLTFSLFYFASDEGEQSSDKYRLLLEGARFADSHGFEAVWTPERHFHAFGGLYPNPAVASAAIASITERVDIRAGSVVLPLHHPARIAEEWALVDNLSRGRVGIACASGWQPVDFVLRPETYADRFNALYAGIETVRKLWRGEAVEFPGPDGKAHAIRTLPRPVQPELPVWVTTAGNIDTWKSAGRIGANVLTHLLGQTVEELSEKVRAYREARGAAGHAGPGVVTMMLHTFVGEDDAEVKEIVRAPMKAYLASSISLVKNVASSWAALKKRADGTQAAAGLDLSALSPEEMDALLDFSFERYYETSGLFGTPETCLALAARLRAIGIDEIACLIDFGVGSALALDHLRHLDALREMAAQSDPATATGAGTIASAQEMSIGALIGRHGVTHLQCTPSMAGMILADDEARAALPALRAWLIGGEAFPASLAREVGGAAPRTTIINMYGPTETTIWSSTHVVEPGAPGATIPIGAPILNTTLYIVDRHLRPTPIGAPGELLIGGAGVVRGYLHRPELTAERFIPDPFVRGGRLYRTGDMARWAPGGVVEFLGRSDHQVKIRGHRIELGEIEAALAAHPAVREAVVVARDDAHGEQRLVGYFLARAEAPAAMDLRAFLRERLPEFMIPSAFVALRAFPLTPNNKVDRKALPAPEAQKKARPAPTPGGAGGAPSSGAGDFEQRIVRIWEDVLGLSSVGLDDNFFDLGGHSLLAVKAHRLLKEALQRDLAITDLFRFPTVRSLAGHLGGTGTDGALEKSESRGEARRELLTGRQARLRARTGAARDGNGA